MEEIKAMDLESKDLVAERIEQMKALFPEIAVEGEGSIDFEKLRLILGEEIEEGDERYAFTWPGKADAIRQSQTVSTATLQPCPEESVNWDTTRNLYIEGDNLEVLKLLQRGYHGRVKMIYIDPPYNTGHDFVYRDKFGDTIENYREQAGISRQSNADTNGRFHSDWCSMMYPRLRLARELLSENGIILISIDNCEELRLHNLCDDVFGEKNFIARVVWQKGRKNDSKYFSDSIEYVFVYAKSAELLAQNNVVWREPKPGLDEIFAFYDSLREKFGNDHQAIELSMRDYYSSLPEGDEKKTLKHFYRSDDRGLFFGGDISSASTSIPDYEILHPVTGRPCKKPARGWGATEPVMLERIADGRVLFGEDETTIPLKKNYLKEVDSIVKVPVIYKDGRAGSKVVERMLGGKYFENPKDVEVLKDLFSYVTRNEPDGIFLDFFSGSGSSAQAVMELNSADAGTRSFIAVQLPEACDQKSKAFGAGFKNICEIGKRRLRVAGQQILDEAARPNLFSSDDTQVDVGFRVLKLDESGVVRPEPGQLLLDRIRPGYTDQDIIFEMMLKWGLELTYPIEETVINGYECYSIAGDALICCMKPGLTVQTLNEIAELEPDRVLILDSILDDTLKLNALQIFKRVEERTQKKIDLRTV